MNVFTFYLIIAFVIYSVLMKLAHKNGRPKGSTKIGVVALALVWPLWEELAVTAIVIYALYSLARAFNAPEPQGKSQ